MDLAGARRGSIRWLFLLALVSSVIASDVDVAKTLIWGPGLNSKITLPVRYFFIQAVNTEGENITSSVGDKAFDVRVTNAQGDPLRIWVQVLDAQDGLYITRLRPYASYSDLVIEVRHQGQHVARSPYSLKGPVYHEQCYCPVASVDKWLQVTGCPASYDQIEADLSPFSQLDMVPIAREMVQRFNEGQRHCLCHYKIIGNKLYRKTYGEHVGFKMFVDDILLSITRKVVLPDMEFFVNLGDWPLEKREVKDKPLPVFSWCGSHDTRDIVMPTYDLTGSVLEMMGRVSLDLFSVQANTGPAWENKTSLAFWRGRDSRQERLDLVMLSRKHPDLVDAALTHMFFFPKDEKKYGDIVKSISFFDFFKHKYQLNIDGTVAAYRLPYLLAGNSVVLKQESPYYEHFYPRLQPYVHFVPLRRDLSDLLTQLQWVKDNDDKAREIARNGQQFTRDHLTPTEIFCYHVKLLNEYSKRIRSKVTVNEDFELVDQPSQGAGCDCKRSTVRQGNHDEL